MAINLLYSNQDTIGKEPDIYIYDDMPGKLRTQIHHILTDAIGKSKSHSGKQAKDVYRFVRDTLIREYGLFNLGSFQRSDYPEEEVLQFLLTCKDVKQTLDVVLLCFQVINGFIRENNIRIQEKSKLKSLQMRQLTN